MLTVPAVYTVILVGVLSRPRVVGALLISASKEPTKVVELVYHFKFVAAHGNDRWCVHLFAKHVGLL